MECCLGSAELNLIFWIWELDSSRLNLIGWCSELDSGRLNLIGLYWDLDFDRLDGVRYSDSEEDHFHNKQSEIN